MNSIVSALRFFFTHTVDRPDLARKLVRLAHPRKLPVVLSRDEVARLLNATTCLKHQAALSVAYGAGLRVAELSTLKVADVDSERMLLRIERGKGGRYRNAMLSQDLLLLLRQDVPTLVGIDHGFSFPLRYFEAQGLLPDWPTFLDDFQRHWPTDEDHTYVDFVRDGAAGNGAARMGSARWRRLTEERAGGAKSVFHFDVQGSVAKSTHAGIPWLRFIRQRLGARVHFWPFDGWDIPAGRSAIAEVYPALWSRGFAPEGRTGDQHDAFSISAWLSSADRDGRLAAFLNPDLSPPERTLAQVEGWILGVPGLIRSAKGRDGSSRSEACDPSVFRLH